MARSPYELLEVAPSAGLAEIRAAYRRKAILFHPDKGGDPQTFAALQDAYALLSNSSRRKHFDETGQRDIPAEDMLRKAMAESRQQADPPTQPSQTRQAPKAQEKPVEAPPEAASSSQAPVERRPRQESLDHLPPALRAAVLGHQLETTPVPEELEQRCTHLTVCERDGVRSIQLLKAFPPIEDSRLREGEVLVQMMALPLSFVELRSEGAFEIGDFFGRQGVGQVLLVGPKVSRLKKGDWVVPLLEVDSDGDLLDGASGPGTGRTLALYKAARCAKLSVHSATVLSIGQMALAKSIGAAYRMVEEFAKPLPAGSTVALNCANGVVGQVLTQLLAVLSYRVIAVVRHHEGVELTRRKLEQLGALKAILDDDKIRERIEELQVPLPQLALDGVGGEATARLAQCLSKTGDVVCYGSVGGSERHVLPAGWGKKWRGTVHQFSFDEWLQKDIEGHSERLSEMLAQAAKLIQANRLQLDLKEYTVNQLPAAIGEARLSGRGHAVVLHLPSLEEEKGSQEVAASSSPDAKRASAPSKSTAETAGVAKMLSKSSGLAKKPIRMSWDLDFLDWEEEGEAKLEKRVEGESSLFKPDALAAEMRIQRYVDDSLATAVALELGAPSGKAKAVLFWLPGPGEVPEEHGPWLERLAEELPGLRVLILRPRVGSKWYDLSEEDAVKLGLRFSVMDDQEKNLEGDPSKFSGDLTFPPLDLAEISAAQQVEGAALGLARRAALEEKSLAEQPGPGHRLPFCFGGFGQGGAIALYTGICLMPVPVAGIVFCHSGIPAAALLGKRMTEEAKAVTRLYGIYDDADKQVPTSFAEATKQMFSLLRCKISLEWLSGGDGHEFLEPAATKAAASITSCFEDVISGRKRQGEEEEPPTWATGRRLVDYEGRQR